MYIKYCIYKIHKHQYLKTLIALYSHNKKIELYTKKREPYGSLQGVLVDIP